MPSRSIRWSLSKPFPSLYERALWRRSIALSLTAICLISSQAAHAVDDTPDIDLAEDPLAAEFARQYDQRLLVREEDYVPDSQAYIPVVAGEDALPPLLEILPSPKVLPTPTIVPPGEPALIANRPPEWILFEPQTAPLEPEWLLYQAQTDKVSDEEQVLAQIDLDYGVGLEDGTSIELPPWPEDEQTSQPSFEIFETELISPFSPIPELDELPFPDA